MRRATAIFRSVRRQDGQSLVLVVLCMLVLLGCVVLAVDVGRIYVTQQRLKTAVNAAALAAGRNMPNAQNAYNAAVSYAGASTENNALGGSGITTTTPTVTFECVSHAPPYPTGSDPTCPADTSSPTTNCHPQARRRRWRTEGRAAMRSTSPSRRP